MRTIDPRAKLLTVFVLTSLALFVQDLWLFLALLAVTGVVSTALGGDWKVLWRLRRLGFLILGLVFLQSIFGAGGTIWLQWGDITFLTSGGLAMGAALAMRFMVILWASSILLAESSRRLVQGLVQWKVPYEIAFMVHLAIRFLPLLQEELQDALAAIPLPGIDLASLGLRQKTQLPSHLFLPPLAGPCCSPAHQPFFPAIDRPRLRRHGS